MDIPAMAEKAAAATTGPSKGESKKPTPPPSPTIADAPMVVAVTPTGAALQWSGPEDGNSKGCEFLLQQCELSDAKGAGGAKTVAVYFGTARSHAIDDLLPGRTYSFRVRATRDGVEGAFGPHVKATTPCVAPGAPGTVQLTGKKKTNVSVKWAGPGSDGGAPITAYTLVWDKGVAAADPEAFERLYSGTEKRFKVANLEPGRLYRLCVTATNRVGQGGMSEITTVSTQAGIPSIPQPPALKSSSVNSLQLVWAAADGNGAEVTEYTLEMEGDYGFKPVYVGPDRAFAVKKLKRVTSYNFRIAARNVTGTSKPSQKTTFKTRASAPGVAYKPKVAESTTSAVRLTCCESADDGGSPINGFVVELAGGICATKHAFPKGKEVQYQPVYTGPDAHQEITGLPAGKAYLCRVACYNMVGCGPFSQGMRMCTAPIPPGQPAPPVVAIGKDVSSTMGVSWKGPEALGGAVVTRYTLEAASAESDGTAPKDESRNDGDAWNEVYDGELMNFVLTGLDPAQKYYFRVAARNAAGLGVMSEAAAAVTSAAAPEMPNGGFSVIASTPTAITVAWAAPEDNGSPIAEYTVECRQSFAVGETKPGAVAPTPTLHTAVSTGVTVAGLEPATNYAFRIKAANAMGVGAFSPLFPVSTASAAPSGPTAPRPDHVDETSAAISWAAPKTNGSPIKHYTLQVNGKMQRLPDSCVKSRTHTLTGLEPNEKYKIRLQASNAIGDSPLSSSMAFFTNLVPPPGPALEPVSSTTTSVKIKWLSPAATNIIEATIQLRDDEGMFQTVYHGTSKSFKCNKLAAGRTHEFRASGANTAGSGPFGPPCFVDTLEAPLPIPDTPFDELDDGTLTLSWELEDLTARLSSDMVYELQVQHVDASLQECTSVVASPDGHTSTATLTTQYDTLYTGVDDSVAITGLPAGLQLLARVRVRERNGGQRLGNFSGISSILLPKAGDDGDTDAAADADADDASMQEEPAVLPAPPNLAGGPAAKGAAAVRAFLDDKLGRGVTEAVESDEVLLAGLAALVLLLAVLIRMLI